MADHEFGEGDEVDEEDPEGEGHPEPEVTIEVSGLSLYTHVGVTEAEREVGQRLLVDLRLESDAGDRAGGVGDGAGAAAEQVEVGVVRCDAGGADGVGRVTLRVGTDDRRDAVARMPSGWSVRRA